MKSHLINFLTILLLALVNAYLCWLLSHAHDENRRALAMLKSANAAMEMSNVASDELQTNCATLIKKGNEVGFAGALYGYEAHRQGMDTKDFVMQAARIFGGTNLPDIHIEIGTNAAELEAGAIRRRL
jgi:hypothetical protein